MKTKKSRVFLLLVLAMVACFCSACSGSGCNIDTELSINTDLSGTRTMYVSVDSDDFNNYFAGTLEDCQNLIINNCPAELSYEFVSADTLEVIFTLSFSSVDDYIEKVANILGEDPEITISVPDSIWASGVYVDESFNSEDLLQWFSDALVDEGYVDSSNASYILDSGDTTVLYNGSSISSSSTIYVDDMEYLSISYIDILTDINAFGDYTRTVIFHIPSSSMDLKGDEITAYMDSIVPSGASYESSDTEDGTDFTYTADGLTAEDIGSFDASLFGEGNSVATEDVDSYYSPFVFSEYLVESLSLSNFLDGDLHVSCYFYVNVSDTYNICVTNDPSYSYDASDSYYADEVYEGYYYVDSLYCYADETYEVPMLFQKTFTVSAIDVSSKHNMSGNSWTRTSVFSFVSVPDEDEESMIIARLEALTETANDSAEDVTGSESVEDAESTEDEPSVGKVTVEGDTEDDIYQITIKQSGDTEEMLYSSELLFGYSGDLSYVSEGGLTKITKTEAFTEYIDYGNILADVTDDFVINYSMKVGLNPKMTYSYSNNGVYNETTDSYDYGSLSDGSFTYTTNYSYVNVLYTGTALDIFTVLFWLAIVAALVLIIIAVIKSGIIPKKAARIPQQPGQPMNNGYPQQPVYDNNGYPQQPAYDNNGYPQQPTYDNTGYSQQPTYDNNGYPQQPAYDNNGYPQQPTYDNNGYPQQPTYDNTGYSQQPVNEGYAQDTGNYTQPEPTAESAPQEGPTASGASASNTAASRTPKFCPSCGAVLTPGSVFCESCGQKVL